MSGFKTAFKRMYLWTEKVFLILGILILFTVAAAAIRMAIGPVNLDFAKDRIETALSDSEKGYKVSFEDIQLTWPSVIGTLFLDLRGVEIEQENAKALSVDHISLGLNGLRLLTGKIVPSTLIIDNPTLELVQKDDSFVFFWQEQEEKVEKIIEEGQIEIPEEESSSLSARQQAADFLNRMTGTHSQNHDIFSFIKRFEVRNAKVVKAEQGEKDLSYIAIANVKLRKSKMGLVGDLTVGFPREGDKQSHFSSRVVYDKEQRALRFLADIKNINPSHFYPYFPDAVMLQDLDMDLNGTVDAVFNDQFYLQRAGLSAGVEEGKFSVPDAYDAPITLKDAIFNASFDRSKKAFKLQDFKAILGGVPLELKTAAIIERGKISAPLELTIPELRLDNVPSLFPKSHIESSAGEWLTKRLSNGRFYDVVLKTNFNVMRDLQTGDRDAVMDNVRVSFKTDGLTVKYSDSLMPVTEVVGEGTYENDTLTIAGQSGKVGDVDGRNVKLKMTDLTVKGGGHAHITMDASGPLATVLKYVSDEPIAVKDQLGFDITKVKGNADFSLVLNFPTVKDLPKEEVKVEIAGKLNDVLIPGVVNGLPLSGGPYDLGFKDGAITLKGKGALADRPVELNWMQYLDSTGREFESKITAKMTSDAYLREAFGVNLDDYISGPLPIEVVYIDKGEKATIDVKGNLSPATLHLEPFDYRKEASVAGDLTLKAFMKGPYIQEIDQLVLKTEGFSLHKGRILFAPTQDGSTDISRGNVPAATLGKTKVSVDFEVTPQNILKIVAKGGVVDLMPFIDKDQQPDDWKKPDDQEVGQAMMISIEADKMLVHEGESIRSGKIYLEMDQQSDLTRLEMDARVGDGDMYLRFRPEPQTGKRTFRMESTDAGFTLKAFGLYDKMRGGKMLIYGQPAQGDVKGNLYGTARIEDFKIKSAPVLAKLLGAMSTKGLDDLLKNDGLVFARLQSDFEWRFREDGNLLVVKDGRTSGSSLGLTFEGVVNQETTNIDISGTIIPFSGVNKALGGIPLIGNILAAGDALIAATYTISGPSNDTKVSVNPLSVLAPGFLRKILFEEKVETKVKKEEKR